MQEKIDEIKFNNQIEELFRLGGGGGLSKQVWVDISSPKRVQENIDDIQSKKLEGEVQRRDNGRTVEKENVYNLGEQTQGKIGGLLGAIRVSEHAREREGKTTGVDVVRTLEFAMKQKKKRKVQMVVDIASQFPFKDLKRMPVGSLGVSVKDYGGHYKTLNNTNPKGGKLTIGLVYENDQKRKRTGNSMCKYSKKYLTLLKAIESSVVASTNIAHPTTYLRAQFLFGPETQKHTDSFRGNWFSYIMPFDAGYRLSVLLFPNFRTSVVEVCGTNYIPLSYSSEKGFLAITFERNQPMKRVILPSDCYKVCKPVGDFDFIVVGVKVNGTIQVAPLGYNYARSPKYYDHLTHEEAWNRMTEKKTKPTKLYTSFHKVGIWNQFVPWQHIHWLSGGTDVRRISVFFRPLREVPTSNNFIMKKGKENWEDRRHLKQINKK